MADRATCPGCRESVSVTPTRRLRAHDARPGIPCPGKGFSLVEPIYPQLIKLWGWETGQKLMKREFPEWVSPEESGPHSPKDLQKLILKAYPDAKKLRLVGVVPGYSDTGVTFTTGPGRWYYAAPNGHVGEGYASEAEAGDALDDYAFRPKGATL